MGLLVLMGLVVVLVTTLFMKMLPMILTIAALWIVVQYIRIRRDDARARAAMAEAELWSMRTEV